jgi:uncharacterized protein
MIAPALLALALLGTAPAAAAAPISAGNLDGVAIVDSLDAAALPAGAAHRFWFRAGDNQLAQPWLVPVIVVRGAKPGPRLLLTAGIHGDELNGIAVIHDLAAIDPASLAGTLVMVPGLNTPGLLQSEREWTPDNGRAQPNLNRAMPGEAGGRGIEDYAGRLWTHLLRRNADTAVDLHTQSRGTAYVTYAFASTTRTRRMAELVAPDIIKLDRGEKGTLENELTNAGVPAITLELGRPEVFDAATIARAGAGLRNLMRELGMLTGPVAPPTTPAFLSNDIVVVRAPVAGFARLQVALGAPVARGDTLAVIADAFGREVARVTAPQSGRVNTIATDPRRGRGDMLLRIVFWSDDPKCAAGC